jgi:hypothetical protein
MTMLDHADGPPDLQMLYAAVTEKLLDGEFPSLRYEVLRHSSPAISVLCHHHARQVGLTLWPNGDAEMTWATAADGDCIAHYRIITQSGLDYFLADLAERLNL